MSETLINEAMLVFIQPPVLVAMIGACTMGWSLGSENRTAWGSISVGIFALAFALALLGVRW